jgi:translation initiation factor IF-3
MDFGKYKYWQKKKLQESRKKSHVSEIKELRLRPKIDDHDLEVKIKKAREFIDDGHKVIINVFFKGREMAHKEFGYQLLSRIEQALADIAKSEHPPQEEGRRIGFTLIRKH